MNTSILSSPEYRTGTTRLKKLLRALAVREEAETPTEKQQAEESINEAIELLKRAE